MRIELENGGGNLAKRTGLRGVGHLPPRCQAMKAEENFPDKGVVVDSFSGALGKEEMAGEEEDKAVKGGKETGGGVKVFIAGPLKLWRR